MLRLMRTSLLRSPWGILRLLAHVSCLVLLFAVSFPAQTVNAADKPGPARLCCVRLDADQPMCPACPKHSSDNGNYCCTPALDFFFSEQPVLIPRSPVVNGVSELPPFLLRSYPPLAPPPKPA